MTKQWTTKSPYITNADFQIQSYTIKVKKVTFVGFRWAFAQISPLGSAPGVMLLQQVLVAPSCC